MRFLPENIGFATFLKCAPQVRYSRFVRTKEDSQSERPGGDPGALRLALRIYFISRYRKVTICPLVQVLSGLKWVASVPLVMFFSTAHRTAL